MSGTHHRTWQQFHVGHLNVTVTLDSPIEGQVIECHQELAGVTRQLIATMEAERVPVTWAVSDPAHSAATPLVLRSAVAHEIAILGDANWVGPTAGRTRFARELTRRVTQARHAGLEINSLVPRVASVEDHIDLVVKQHITAVAGLTASIGDRQSSETRALHYGVWEVPISATLPLKATWFGSGKRTLWRTIRRTANEAGTLHLLIDASAIAAAAARSEESVVRWLVHRAATLRDRGLIRFETLRTTAARLSDVPAISPQRSILRRVA
jgi:hypothetical protein